MAGTPLLEPDPGDPRRERASPRCAGILNGTTNYILTQMEGGHGLRRRPSRRPRSSATPRRCPTPTCSGWDALAKVTILANVVFGANLTPADSPCQGITEITPDDIAAAKAEGQRYKLIGRVWRDGERRARLGGAAAGAARPSAGRRRRAPPTP